MKISFNWLKQFVETDLPAPQVAEILTDLGLEVEGMDTQISIPGGLKGVVIGKVLTCVQHPNADRLKLTTVDIGKEEPVQIVCGAPNVAAGQTVPVATIGTILYDKEGQPWTINKGKIRGEESHGMICAEDELSLGESHDGIMILSDEHAAGKPLSSVIKVEEDTVFDIGLTPNRSDAMSHLGVARDLRAGLKQHGTNRELITPSVSSFHVDNYNFRVDINVKQPELAPRYCGVTVSDVKVGPSPTWLQNRLKAIGLNPINNIVDVTNFVLHDLGQPLHAFDALTLTDNKIIVQTVDEGTKFVTLDGVERTLSSEDLMICDGEKPLCIAGVFGGINSGVSETTTSIFLESAYFDPISVRKTAKRHGLSTDASFRFERGIDPNITEYALKRAVLLILEVAGGKVTSEISDLYPTKIKDHQVIVNFEKANKTIGKEIDREQIKQILTYLDIKINSLTETGIGMTIPAYRNDVTREIDVIEEILRVYGYNNINASRKLNAAIVDIPLVSKYQLMQLVSQGLVANGFFEIMTNSLVPNDPEDKNAVRLLNPLSADLEMMRTSLCSSGLQVLAYNNNRQQTDLRCFEFGKIYTSESGQYTENQILGLWMMGQKSKKHWQSDTQTLSFFDLKGYVVATLQGLGLSGLQEVEVVSATFSVGQTLMHDKKALVSYGQVNDEVLQSFDLDRTVFFAEFDWEQICKITLGSEPPKFKTISKYPSAKRDLALVIDRSVSFDALKQIAFKTERKMLKEVDMFDEYIGKPIPAGKKSYGLRFTIQDEHKTMSDQQIDKIMKQLLTQFEQEVGAVQR
ncbi:MAG: phenylalanine--tRNA ligase subunit beta [Flavobacteriaceae bacterium]|nr:phenylalanine--tRNA ligase subunit beta [Flavobacteriaceae bacterium]